MTIQTAQLQRTRHYNDETQHYDCKRPQDAPSWSYIEQETYDAESDNMLNVEDAEDENLLVQDNEAERIVAELVTGKRSVNYKSDYYDVYELE